MSSQHSSLFLDSHPPGSFSFDNMSRIQPPKKSIDQFLRLRTNQSIEDRPFSSKQLKKDRKKPLRTEESQAEDQHCLKLAQGEFDLRMESLVKQYQLKLNKQEEYFGLKEWKLKQELQNLERQNMALVDEMKKTKSSAKNSQSHCPLCSNGEIVNQLAKLLADNEQNHQNCLADKKEQSRRQNQIRAKYEVLEEQHEKLNSQLRATSKQNRSLQSKIRELEEEKDSLAKSLKQSQNQWREKIYSVEMSLKMLQRELSQKNAELNNSKATVQSLLTSTQQSLKSSYILAKDSKDQKENEYSRGRKSMGKVNLVEQQSRHSQNRQCVQKLSQNIDRNMRGQKYESIHLNYF